MAKKSQLQVKDFYRDRHIEWLKIYLKPWLIDEELHLRLPLKSKIRHQTA
jgi:hypothetical protein